MVSWDGFVCLFVCVLTYRCGRHAVITHDEEGWLLTQPIHHPSQHHHHNKHTCTANFLSDVDLTVCDLSSPPSAAASGDGSDGEDDGGDEFVDDEDDDEDETETEDEGAGDDGGGGGDGGDGDGDGEEEGDGEGAVLVEGELTVLDAEIRRKEAAVAALAREGQCFGQLKVRWTRMHMCTHPSPHTHPPNQPTKASPLKPKQPNIPNK